MKNKLHFISYLLLLSFVGSASAGTNPVNWSISPATGLPANTTVGSSYAVTYTISNNLPFAVPLTVTGDYTGGTFSLANGCNTTLAAKNQANSSCLVHLSFQPIKAGTNTAQIILAYHRNRVPLTLLTTTATSGTTVDNISGHVTIPLPAVTYTGVSYPVEFSYVNTGTATVTATAVNASGFTPSTNCNAPLAPNAPPCTVTGTFTPVATGQATLSATYTYNNGSSVSVPLSTQTNVHTGSGPCHHVAGFTPLPLPVTTYQYANHVVKFTFTNECDASTETLGTFSVTASSAATLTKGADTCSNTTLAADASCSVYVSVVPTVAANLTVTGSIPYDTNTLIASSSTSTQVNALTNQTTLHTFIFVNQCDQNVWYGFQNGNGSGKSPDPTPVANRTWSGYQMNQQLTGAAPVTKVLQFSQYSGGSIVGRTGCDTVSGSPTYGVCNTANCTSLNNSTGTCGNSAPTSPATTFEEDIQPTLASDGVYDISIINGFNIPGEMRSLGPTTPGAINFNSACGQSGGAIIQPSDTGLGICPWTFTPPSTGTDCTAGTSTDNASNYYFVPAGADDGCTPGSCSGSDVCGMSWTPQPSINPQYLGTPITRHCGAFQGYWTVTDWVNYTDHTDNWGTCDLYEHYNMNQALPTGPTGSSYGNSTLYNGSPAASYGDMYACKPTTNDSLDSGYDANKTNACGCYDWNQPGSVALTAQATNCLSTNSQWTPIVFDRIKWLKQACPTAYSYQFDDKSVSFTCNASGQLTSYQITFCPGGVSGQPV